MSRFELALLQLATVLYVGHGVGSAVGFFRARRARAVARWGPVVGALVLHTAFLLSRCIEAGGVPIETRVDSVALFLWVTAVVFLATGRPYRLQGMAPVFWCLFAGTAVGMWVVGGGGPVSGASLARSWLLLHLVPVYAGYGGFAVAAGAGLAYLVQERLLRGKGSGALWRKLPSLEALERVDRTALSLGFPLLTVGLVAGVLWAERGSAPLGLAWHADPKVVGGLVVWVFYAAVLHVRLFVCLRGRRAALLTVAGFALTLASFATVHVYSSERGPAREAGPRSAGGRAAT